MLLTLLLNLLYRVYGAALRLITRKVKSVSRTHLLGPAHLGGGSWGEETPRPTDRSDFYVSAGIAQHHGQAKNPETSFT